MIAKLIEFISHDVIIFVRARMYNVYVCIPRHNRLLKGESFDGRDSFRGAMLRPSVSKSFSFGGYTKGMLSRGDSVTSTHSAGARLMKQGAIPQSPSCSFSSTSPASCICRVAR